MEEPGNVEFCGALRDVHAGGDLLVPKILEDCANRDVTPNANGEAPIDVPQEQMAERDWRFQVYGNA